MIIQMEPGPETINDNDKISSIKSIAVRKKIFAKLPKDIATNFKYYIRGYIHGILYIGSLGMAYYYQQKYYTNPPMIPITFRNKTYNLGKSIPYIFSPIVSWAMSAVFMLGHEGQHKSFAPKKRFLGKLINKIVNLFGYQSVAASSRLLTPMHNNHHKYLNTKNKKYSDDEMIILSWNLGVSGEILHTIWFVMRWNLSDLFTGLNIFNSSISFGYRLFMTSAVMFRVSVIFGGDYFIKKNKEVHMFDDNKAYKLVSVKYNNNLYNLKLLFRPFIGLSNVMEILIY